MSLNPALRSRICGSKSRSGCLNCKARHLKCDELKPCTRCARSGRVCKQSVDSKTLRMIQYVPAPSWALDQYAWPDAVQMRYLHRYRTRTAPELAGVYCAEVWTRYTIHIAASEPAIKHAIIGLAALHEQFERSTDLTLHGSDMQYPLSQYTKAISLLTKTGCWELEYPDTPLIACMLFCAFESLSFHLDSAVSHLSSGLKILAEHRQRAEIANGKTIPPKLVSSVYKRLDTQGLELGETSLSPLPGLQLVTPMNVPHFTSVHEAQTEFYEIVNSLFHEMYEVDKKSMGSVRNINPTEEAENVVFKVLLSNYRSWCTAFDHFVTERIAAGDLAPCLLLQLWRILININLQVDLRLGEMDFDRFATDFQAIVNLASEFALLRCAQKSMQETRIMLRAAPSQNKEHEQPKINYGIFNSDSVRGGYLGVHPVNTPFASGPISDSNAVRKTTYDLLRKTRSTRESHLDSKWTNEGRVTWEEVLPDMEPSFSFGPGIVSPLYVTISRCRDHSIQRQALLLMQKCNRREGLWDSTLAARLGTRVVQIEEQRARELYENNFELSSAFPGNLHSLPIANIPNEARVRMIKPTFLPDRKSIERYFLGWPGSYENANNICETWIEEIMEW